MALKLVVYNIRVIWGSFKHPSSMPQTLRVGCRREDFPTLLPDDLQVQSR